MLSHIFIEANPCTGQISACNSARPVHISAKFLQTCDLGSLHRNDDTYMTGNPRGALCIFCFLLEF